MWQRRRPIDSLSTEVHHEVDDLRLPSGPRPEAELAEYLAHGRVLRQHFRRQFRQSGVTRNACQMPHQMPSKALPLIAVDDDESDLRSARFNDNIAPATHDGRAAIFVS